MLLRFDLISFLLLTINFPAVAQSAATEPAGVPIDQRIDAWFRPISDAVSNVIFYSVRVGGTDAAPVSFPLILGWLILAGLICTVYFRFINVSGFMHGLRLLRGKYAEPNAVGEVSHFQALTSAVSGTVGLGNIAGVAVALSIGGAGATFWMILAGLLGMSTKFVECTLGVKYRIVNTDGSVSGGPMYYLSGGIAENYPRLKGVGAALAALFAVCTVLGAVGSGAMFQANQAYAQFFAITGGDAGPLAGRGWLFGIALAVLTGAVSLGGISRIGQVTAKLVPGMAVLYVLGCLIVIGVNLDHVPSALAAIFQGAFTAEGVQGGLLGALIQGFRRAAFSNEAGLGSAAIAHSAVRTRDPVTEGFVALWEPFIDTILICTMTALVIIISGELSALQGSALSGTAQGVQLTSQAFGTVSAWFPYVLTGVVFLFAYSTMITWAYYGAKAAGYLTRESRTVQVLFNLVFMAMVVIGCTLSLGSLVDFADSLLFMMAIPNLVGVYLLLPVVRRELLGYRNRLAAGVI